MTISNEMQRLKALKDQDEVLGTEEPDNDPRSESKNKVKPTFET